MPVILQTSLPSPFWVSPYACPMGSHPLFGFSYQHAGLISGSQPALLCPMLQWTGPPGHPSISLVTTLANSDSSDAHPSLFLRHHRPPKCPGHTLERPPPRIPSAPALGGTAVHPPDTACPISHHHVPGGQGHPLPSRAASEPFCAHSRGDLRRTEMGLVTHWT